MSRLYVRFSVSCFAFLLFGCAGSGQRHAWHRTTFEEAGVDEAAIVELVADIEAGHYGNVDHFLLARGGKIVADHHFQRDYVEISKPYDPEDHAYDYDHPSWHPYYQGTRLHTLQSVTKSITSICVGIAMDEGRIPGGVEAPAMSFFSQYEPDLSDPRRRAMTLQDLLTMRSGIAWDESISYEDPANSCIQLESSQDWVRYVLAQPMSEDPGTRFNYNSGASVLIGKIVRVATGRRIDEYAAERLFKPLGITEWFWKETPCGEIDTEGGLYLAPRDLARIAQLFLQKGTWRGRRVVSESWVEESVEPHVTLGSAPGRPDSAYGYQWWVAAEDGRAVAYQGSGYGGQFPIVIPDLDLVVVFNAWNIHDRPSKSTTGALRDIIRPAVRGGAR